MAASRPVPAVPAATILLVRDTRAGLEVFMVQRHHEIEFAKGAMVFPGGKVDPGDGDRWLRPRCANAEALDDETLMLRVAAIRETFEECSVLLARPHGSRELVGADRLRQLEDRHRAAFLADGTTMHEFVEAEDLELASDLLVSFAHWITPEFMPRRYDTHFFLVPAPEDQIAVHDGGESVDSLWITPGAAVAEARTGRRTIIFPTLLNLRKLGSSRTVAEAVERARREPIVTVMPTLVRGPHGPVMRISPEAGYGEIEVPAGGPGPGDPGA